MERVRVDAFPGSEDFCVAENLNVWMLIWTYWPGPEGGAERQCRHLVKHLTARGVRVTVITSRHDGGVPHVSHDGAASIVRLGRLCPLVVPYRRIIERLLRPLAGHRIRPALQFWILEPVVFIARLSFLAGLLRLMRHSPDRPMLVHVHEASWLAGVGVWMARRLGCRVISKEATYPSLNPIGFDTPFRSSWDRLRMDSAYLAPTVSARQGLLDRGIPPEAIHLLPNGVELPAALGEPDGRTILYVGNFSQGAAWKAFDVILAAWSAVHRVRPDLQLLMVGGGDTAPWQQLALRLGCGPSVVFTGAVPAPDVYYRTAAAFILPSRVEGLSNALLEAQSWGLPCVVSDIPGNTAVVTDDFNGIVVPTGDAAALAAGILRVTGDPGLSGRLGAEARRLMEREFALDSVTERLIGIYRRVNCGADRPE